MTVTIGINGLGRIGRLLVRILAANPDVNLAILNDPGGDAHTFAHLIEFDSVHGHWPDVELLAEQQVRLGNSTTAVYANRAIEETDWSGCDIVIDATGRHKTSGSLQPYLDQEVKQVVVSAPVKEDGVLNVVMGVNHRDFDARQHSIVTAASCTTNCLAPIVAVLQRELGIRHGSMTTIHDITNTQVILDSAHKDLRRARACGMSLIPTTTGSATAITHIFPELKGRLNGHAVRVPLANASLTDCVFELEKKTTKEEVNQLFKRASEGELAGILGYEERPLVSIDFRTDPRSSIVDALSTMVVNDTQLKVYTWYDNEWGYANRTAELALLTAAERGL